MRGVGLRLALAMVAVIAAEAVTRARRGWLGLRRLLARSRSSIVKSGSFPAAL